jgi:hypothetical protein
MPLQYSTLLRMACCDASNMRSWRPQLVLQFQPALVALQTLHHFSTVLLGGCRTAEWLQDCWVDAGGCGCSTHCNIPIVHFCVLQGQLDLCNHEMVLLPLTGVCAQNEPLGAVIPAL